MCGTQITWNLRWTKSLLHTAQILAECVCISEIFSQPNTDTYTRAQEYAYAHDRTWAYRFSVERKIPMMCELYLETGVLEILDFFLLRTIGIDVWRFRSHRIYAFNESMHLMLRHGEFLADRRKLPSLVFYESFFQLGLTRVGGKKWSSLRSFSIISVSNCIEVQRSTTLHDCRSFGFPLLCSRSPSRIFLLVSHR